MDPYHGEDAYAYLQRLVGWQMWYALKSRGCEL